jgi:hypothetical protein
MDQRESKRVHHRPSNWDPRTISRVVRHSRPSGTHFSFLKKKKDRSSCHTTHMMTMIVEASFATCDARDEQKHRNEESNNPKRKKRKERNTTVKTKPNKSVGI